MNLSIFANDPLKHEKTDERDFRTILTNNHKETLYDGWQLNFGALNQGKALHPIAMPPYQTEPSSTMA